MLVIFTWVFNGIARCVKNTDLGVKILLQKTLVLENLYKLDVPIFGAAYVAPNKAITIYTN